MVMKMRCGQGFRFGPRLDFKTLSTCIDDTSSWVMLLMDNDPDNTAGGSNMSLVLDYVHQGYFG